MRGTETWMAAQAKVVIAYDRAFWREAGQSGNAFVTHEQAVIGEIFDACDGDPGNAALGGFLALSPELRANFSVGLPMLMGSQMVQVFGAALGTGRAALSGLGDRALYLQRARPDLAPQRTCRGRQSDAAPAAMGRQACIWPGRKPHPAAPAISKARSRRRGELICRSTVARMQAEAANAGRVRRQRCRLDQCARASPAFPAGSRRSRIRCSTATASVSIAASLPSKASSSPSGRSSNRWKRCSDNALEVLDGLAVRYQRGARSSAAGRR